jgi:hypothetical protein
MTASPLAFFLFDAEERIVNETTRRLRESPLEHYRQMETLDLRPRMEAHYAAYREAVLSGDGAVFASYVADIGRKRLQQGYDLEELLVVLDTLFETVWETAAAAWRERGAEAFDDLKRLAQGVSWGKDRLATVYAEESKKERAALRRLSAAFDEYLRLRHPPGGEGPDAEKRGTP